MEKMEKFLLPALLFVTVVLPAHGVEPETADETLRFDIEHAAALISESQLDVRSSTIKATENETEPSTVCYAELGCFDKSIGNRFPSDPDTVPPAFIMSTRHDSQVDMRWNDTSETLESKTADSFEKERLLIFLAHGFGESLQKPWIWNLRNATLKAYPDANVVIIDWGLASYFPLYNRAASNVPLIANMTVQLTKKLMGLHPSIKAKNIYFIGFSLGAQMAGYYARSFINQTNEKIGRITSLDAAAPLFEERDVVPRRGIADFVEAIHTSAGNNIVIGKVGYIQPYADIDFYPNGGIKQPGCFFLHVPCSHQRAFLYLTHTLDDSVSCKFKGVQCANLNDALEEKCSGPTISAYFGMKNVSELPPQEEYRVISLKTHSQSPFCLPDPGV